MRKVFVGASIIAFAGPLLGGPAMASPQATVGGLGPPVGVLGPIDALGQDFRLPPAPTGPPPRLLDGTINLGDGIWIGKRGDNRGLAQGLKPGRGGAAPAIGEASHGRQQAH